LLFRPGTAGTDFADVSPNMSRPPRIAGFDYKGLYRYFLTICTLSRKKVFEDPAVVSETLMEFRKTSHEQKFEISAYCFMPDHSHFLIEGLTDSSDFKRFCKLAKQRSGSCYARKRGGPLWQEGYHERVLREGDDSRVVARYLLSNPVRAGLVATPIEYPYLGSDRWTVAQLLEAQQ
jgi:REP element-mobilizing transposase RayT